MAKEFDSEYCESCGFWGTEGPEDEHHCCCSGSAEDEEYAVCVQMDKEFHPIPKTL